ncbi:MAG: methyltransferase domain-containing protein [Candidatus Magnetoovum sp. WYHC-5]|nr:methyltransferase domain-containing protein [Candidatus Magnetoovum sp. WYHC-5]
MRNFVKLLSFNTFIPFFYPALMLPIDHYRKKAFKKMDFKLGDKVIVPGSGAGHDLTIIPKDVEVVGIDISDVMIGISKIKLKAYGRDKNVVVKKMDAEKLPLGDNSFDKAILSLFLTVVFDPKKAFAEIVRVIKPGGKILVFDHLFRKGELPSIIAKPIDSVLKYSFASVTRNIDEIIEGLPVVIEEVIPGDPVGFVKSFFIVKQ